jgi:hypothetical protein
VERALRGSVGPGVLTCCFLPIYLQDLILQVPCAGSHRDVAGTFSVLGLEDGAYRCSDFVAFMCLPSSVLYHYLPVWRSGFTSIHAYSTFYLYSTVLPIYLLLLCSILEILISSFGSICRHSCVFCCLFLSWAGILLFLGVSVTVLHGLCSGRLHFDSCLYRG